MTGLMSSRDKTHPSFVWDLVGGGGSMGVQLVLHNRQQLAPTILLEVAKHSQCGLHVLVGFLALAICLWMVGT